MNNRILFLLTLLGAACYTGSLEAAYEDVGVGARVTGLGNAYTAIADDVYSVYYNPAGLGTLYRTQVATTYSRLFVGLSDNSSLQNSFLAFAHPIREGHQGAYGLGWNFMSLDSLYRESSVFGSYGRQLMPQWRGGQLYSGLSVKYLTRSLSKTSVADNPLDDVGQIRPGFQDPVLQNASRGNLDLDWGALYRFRQNYTVGMTVTHLLEPNVAFSSSDTDPLKRSFKVGAAYKSAWTTLATDFGLRRAPDGTYDRVFVMAAEKWLPTLLRGTFGFRGSVGIGDRDFKQVTAGLSYRIFKLQFDYGFSIPLGTVTGTFGTHRMGLAFLFGRPKVQEPKVAEAILENMRELTEMSPREFRYAAEEVALYKRTAMEQFMREARLRVNEGRFREATFALTQAQSLNPADRNIQGSRERVSFVAEFYPELKLFTTDAIESTIYQAAHDFIFLRDRDAVRKLTYALSLKGRDEDLEAFLVQLEARTRIARAPALPLPPKPAPTLGQEVVVEEKMRDMEDAMRTSNYAEVARLAGQVAEMAPRNLVAWKRLGAASYALKRYPESLKALQAAYELETERAGRRQLKGYIQAMEALLERRAAEAAARVPVPVKPGPMDVERMYEAGVDLYAQGRLQEAAGMFKEMLKVDPDNSAAKKALARIESDLILGGERR